MHSDTTTTPLLIHQKESVSSDQSRRSTDWVATRVETERITLKTCRRKVDSRRQFARRRLLWPRRVIESSILQ
ncbi:MAG TPA: hypothetical protein DDX19_04195 [Rhodopirellula baltica]|uniref:Uncharacterized protein n=1 Tax=Rhodopirellula baltica (strain DSM 10527 / NCIMB 13988 / SH1) TaxID=243090 RepID=Q7UG19_RHOBA|nr:hypothetical protein RB8191 [Rhodopirellula baltica SH 1]HBE61968.1 hypothetical protein [Rhodopirellula baltica]